MITAGTWHPDELNLWCYGRKGRLFRRLDMEGLRIRQLFQEDLPPWSKKETKAQRGKSLVAQWLRLCTFTAKGEGSIPGEKIKDPPSTSQGAWAKQNKTKQKSTEKWRDSALCPPVSSSCSVITFLSKERVCLGGRKGRGKGKLLSFMGHFYMRLSWSLAPFYR